MPAGITWSSLPTRPSSGCARWATAASDALQLSVYCGDDIFSEPVTNPLFTKGYEGWISSEDSPGSQVIGLEVFDVRRGGWAAHLVRREVVPEADGRTIRALPERPQPGASAAQEKISAILPL